MIPAYVAWRSPRCRGWREEDPTGAQYAVRMFSYTPAAADRDAWGLITDRFVLSIATDAGHALELWRTMTTPDATLESILEALVTRGVRVIPDFALIELLDASTGSASLALRGRGRAEVGSAQHQRYSGKGAATWVEASTQQIAELTIGLRGEPPGPARLPVERGVVRTEQVHWGIPLPEFDTAVEHSSEPRWATGMVPSADPEHGELDDRTVIGSRAAARADLDDATVIGQRRVEPRLALHFRNGPLIPIAGTVVFGRSPTRAGATTVALASPRHEVSATHAEVVAEGVQLRLRDLRSTNGTFVTVGDGPTIEVRDREITLAPGDRVDFGDGNIAEVTLSR